MRPPRRVWVALLVATMLVACDPGGARPADRGAARAFESAVAELADYDGVALTFTLESTPGDLAKLDGGTQVLDPGDAAKILSSSLTVVSKDEGSQAGILFDIAGNQNAVELRIVDRSLFARADVRDLFETFDADPGALDAMGLDFLAPAIDGEWLGVADVDRVVGRLRRSTAATPAGTETTGEQLAAILSDNSGIASEGTDETGDHLSVELPLRKSMQGFFAALGGLGGLPAGAVPLPDTSRLPDDDVTLDAWIDDGRLVQLEADLLELGDVVGEDPPGDVDRYALRMRFEEFTSDVSEPRAATMLDPGRVVGAFLGGIGRLSD